MITITRTWEDRQNAFEVWKYYGGVGGADKDYMIKMDSLLLGFSSAIAVAYAHAELKDYWGAVVLMGAGIVISGLAAFIALLYGGYSAWNWAIADRIAESYGWTDQRPTYDPFEKNKAHWTAGISLWLARPSGTKLLSKKRGQRSKHKIAPVFWFFFLVSSGSLLVHVGLLWHVVSAHSHLCSASYEMWM
jgi:hypothetical protein